MTLAFSKGRTTGPALVSFYVDSRPLNPPLGDFSHSRLPQGRGEGGDYLGLGPWRMLPIGNVLGIGVTLSDQLLKLREQLFGILPGGSVFDDSLQVQENLCSFFVTTKRLFFCFNFLIFF